MARFSSTPFTLVLMGINISLFLAEKLFSLFYATSLFPDLALSREGLDDGAWWQLLTHAFLHGNIFHLMVNMVALWFTGPLLEELLGGWRYLGLYVGGILVGGLLQTFGSPENVPLVGASGAVCALLVGFSTLLPRLEITALIFFVIPVRMKAATLGWLVVAGSLLFWVFGIERGIGHLAHLGGGVAGYLICKAYQACGLVRPLPMELPSIPERIVE